MSDETFTFSPDTFLTVYAVANIYTWMVEI